MRVDFPLHDHLLVISVACLAWLETLDTFWARWTVLRPYSQHHHCAATTAVCAQPARCACCRRFDASDKGLPFFVFFYIDEHIALAKGRGGGWAYWTRTVCSPLPLNAF